MKNQCYTIIFFLFPFTLYGQEDVVSGLRDKTTETKIGADFNLSIGKKKKMILTPSIRSVFSNTRANEQMTSYQGLETELCYGYSVLKWLRLKADVEIDIQNNGNLEFSYFFAAAPSYKINRLIVFGEFKLSNNRNLSYFDKHPSHHFSYMVGMGYEIIKNVMTLKAKATFPHNIKTNTFEKVQVKIFMDVTLTRHFGMNISYQRTEDFTKTNATYTPAFNFVYNF